MWSDAERATDILKRSRRPLLSFFLPFPSSRNNLFPKFPNRRTTLSIPHLSLAARHPCPVPAACRLLAAALVLSPLRAVCSPPPLSSPRCAPSARRRPCSCPCCAPSARRRPCPVPAARRPLASTLVLSSLRADRSPPPLPCPRCAPSARRRPVLSSLRAVCSPPPLSCLLPEARLTLCRYIFRVMEPS